MNHSLKHLYRTKHQAHKSIVIRNPLLPIFQYFAHDVKSDIINYITMYSKVLSVFTIYEEKRSFLLAFYQTTSSVYVVVLVLAVLSCVGELLQVCYLTSNLSVCIHVTDNTADCHSIPCYLLNTNYPVFLCFTLPATCNQSLELLSGMEIRFLFSL